MSSRDNECSCVLRQGWQKSISEIAESLEDSLADSAAEFSLCPTGLSVLAARATVGTLRRYPGCELEAAAEALKRIIDQEVVRVRRSLN